jgi:hypothetical protein
VGKVKEIKLKERVDFVSLTQDLIANNSISSRSKGHKGNLRNNPRPFQGISHFLASLEIHREKR